LQNQSKEALIKLITQLDHENTELKQRLNLAKAKKVVKMKHI